MAFASFTNADNVLRQIGSQTDGDAALTINGSTLNQWLTTLQTTSTRLQQELQLQVAGLADTSFLPAYQYNDQVYQRADRQVKDALTSSQAYLSSASTMTNQTTQSSSDTRSLAEQAYHSRAIVTTLKSLVTISKDLDQVDTSLSQGAIVDATRRLLVVLDHQANEQSDGSGLSIRHHLRTRAERYKTLLANTIHDGLTQSIILTNDGGTVFDLSIQHSIAFTNGSSNTTLGLKDLLMASTLLQTQYVELASIQRNIVKKLITPLLDGGGNVQLPTNRGTVQLTVDEMDQAAVSKLHLIMTPPTTHHDDNNDNTTALNIYEARCSTASDRLQHTLVIVRFVFDHLFGPEPHWLAMRQLFGRLFLPDVFQLVIKSVLAPAIPSTTTSTDILGRLASLGSSAAAFEQQCVVEYAGITPPSSNTTDNSDDTFPLAQYVSQLDKHVAQQRHSRLLHDARQVMLRPIYDTEPDATLGISITQTPRILYAMIQELTAEATSLEQQNHYPKTSQTLRNTTHAILVLYMSIMPSIHRPEFLQHVDRAIVFRNDCYWLATNTQQEASDDIRSKLEGLGDLWQSVVVAQLMNTVAIVLDRTEEWQLDGDGQQQRQGGMTLDPKQPIGTTTTSSQQQQRQHQEQQQQVMSLENAIAIIIAQIQSLANVIKPVVTTTLFNAILIELVNSVVGRLADDLLAMADISAEASHTMALALNGVAQLANVFLSDDDDSFGGSVSEIQLRQWIPRWQGFWMVKEMLELTMADILAALHRGDLCMFTHQELVHLVCALFADTPRRDETIRIIKTSDLNGSSTAAPATTITTTKRDIASLLDPVIESPKVKHASEPPPQPLATQDRDMMISSPHNVDKDMVTSSSRLVFDVEEGNVDDNGWDQEGWSDDDDLDFNITPISKGSLSTNQENLLFGHPIAESCGVESDKEGELNQETNIPMDISLHDDNEDEFDSEMNMPLDDQDSSYLDIDSGNQFGKVDNVNMNQDTPKALEPSTDESNAVVADKDGVLDDEETRPLDLKDNQNIGQLLENEENYNTNEPMEATCVQHEDSRSPEIEHLTGGNTDMNVDTNGALDQEMNTPLEDQHANQKDKKDDHIMDQFEDRHHMAAQKHHEDSQSPQNEYSIGEISDMDTTMIDDLDTTTNKPHGDTLNQAQGRDDLDIPWDNQNRLFVDDGNDDLDSSKITPLDDEVNQQLEALVEDDGSSGKDDNTHITHEEEHADSLSPRNEHTVGRNTDIVADKNNAVGSGMILLDVSTGDNANTTDALLDVPQNDKDKQGLDITLEAENDSGKSDYTQTHQKHYEGSELSAGKEVTEDTIKNNDDFRTDIPLGKSLDNLIANVDNGTLEHGEESPLDDQDSDRLDVDVRSNLEQGARAETTQNYHHDYQLPIHITGDDIDSKEENSDKGMDWDIRTDTSKEKQPMDTCHHGSLINTTHSMDMLLDDDEGGGWSDADHDIDLDLNLLSNSGSLVAESLLSASTDHNTKFMEITTHSTHSSPTADTAFSKNVPSVPSPHNSPVTLSRSYSQTRTTPLTPFNNTNPPSSSLLHHQQISAVTPSPSPSPSKFSMIDDTVMDDNFDNEGDGGWSDAENIMEFDTTFPTIAPAPAPAPASEVKSNIIDHPSAKTSIHHQQPEPAPSIKAGNNDNNTSNNNNKKIVPPPTRSNFMMDLALEDDDNIGGGWSDADEELF